MTTSGNVGGARLRGRHVFLSASIPSRYRARRFRRLPEAPIWISEAVIALTRAVLAHGGELVMGAHPTISPLVAQVAGEYRLPAVVEGERPSMARQIPGVVEPHIVIYQSRVFEGHLPPETLFLEQLGLARLIWTDVVGDESFHPERRMRTPPAPRSVQRMRERMFEGTGPAALVCIGGMEGVIDEARLFARLRPGARVYALETTGGAASLIADDPQFAGSVRAIDREVVHELELQREQVGAQPQEEIREPGDAPESWPREPQVPPAVPYPLIMQMIVDQLAGG